MVAGPGFSSLARGTIWSASIHKTRSPAPVVATAPALAPVLGRPAGVGPRHVRPVGPVRPVGTAARLHKAALLEAGENQLQEFLRDFLPPGDVRDDTELAGLRTVVFLEIENRAKRRSALEFRQLHSRVRFRDRESAVGRSEVKSDCLPQDAFLQASCRSPNRNSQFNTGERIS